MKFKKHIPTLIALTAVLTLGVSLYVNHHKVHTEVDATPVTENFAPYTYSGSYYNSITADGEGLDGSLRQALTPIIRPQGFVTYSSGLSQHCQQADEDQNNKSNMVLFYSRDSVKKQAAGTWNREHVWPKALSNGNWGESQAGTDILHLRPTYVKTNSTRSSHPFGDASNGNVLQYNGMTYGKLDGNIFEPLDCVKGDVARIIMYIWTAYKGYSGYSALSITSIFDSYNTLLTWHTMDKPDALEGHRNDYVQNSTVQKNRNPFVDHPEYAWKIFGNNASSAVKAACMEAYPSGGVTPVNPTGITLDKTSASVEINKTMQLTATLQPSGATGSITWSSADSTIASVNGSGRVTGVALGTTTITATCGSYHASCSVIVTSAGTGGDYLSETVELDYTGLTGQGDAIDSSTAMAKVGRGNSHVESVSVSKIYDGNASGGAYPNTSGFLKTGSSSANGSISFTLDGAANKVEILCHDFYQKSNQNPTNSNTVSVNGSATQLAPYNENATFETLTFNLDEASDEITIDVNKRIFIKNIKISYVGAATNTYTVTFDSNGGSSVASQTVEEGLKAQEPEDPTKEPGAECRYAFAGWYSDEGLTSAYDFDAPVTEDITLYAKWETIEISAQEKIEQLETQTTLSYRYSATEDGVSATDTLTREDTGRTDTNYGEWTTIGDSGVTYVGQSAGGNDSIQLRSKYSNSGIIVTSNPDGIKVTSVSVDWNSNTPNAKILNIYGKNTAYSSPTDLFGNGTRGDLLGEITCGTSTNLTIAGDYEYIGVCSDDGAIYLNSIEFEWGGSTTTYSYSDVSIRFTGRLAQDLWTELDTDSHIIEGFGVMIATDDVIEDGECIMDYSDTAIPDENNPDVTEDVVDYYMPKEDMATPVVSGSNYYWNLFYRISNENLTTTYVAAAYIKIDTGYVFFDQVRYSVKSLAQDYLDNRNCDSTTAGGSLANLANL